MLNWHSLAEAVQMWELACLSMVIVKRADLSAGQLKIIRQEDQILQWEQYSAVLSIPLQPMHF